VSTTPCNAPRAPSPSSSPSLCADSPRWWPCAWASAQAWARARSPPSAGPHLRPPVCAPVCRRRCHRPRPRTRVCACVPRRCGAPAPPTHSTPCPHLDVHVPAASAACSYHTGLASAGATRYLYRPVPIAPRSAPLPPSGSENHRCSRAHRSARPRVPPPSPFVRRPSKHAVGCTGGPATSPRSAGLPVRAVAVSDRCVCLVRSRCVLWWGAAAVRAFQSTAQSS